MTSPDGFRTELRNVAPVALGGFRAGGTGQPVQVRIFGDDLDKLTRLSRVAQTRLSELPDLIYATNSMTASPIRPVAPVTMMMPVSAVLASVMRICSRWCHRRLGGS